MGEPFGEMKNGAGFPTPFRSSFERPSDYPDFSAGDRSASRIVRTAPGLHDITHFAIAETVAEH